MVAGGFELVGHDGLLDFLHGDLLDGEVVLYVVGHVRLAVLYGVQSLLLVPAASHQLRLEQRRGFGPGAVLRGVDGADLERGVDDIGKTALLVELRRVELAHLRSHTATRLQASIAFNTLTFFPAALGRA